MKLKQFFGILKKLKPPILIRRVVGHSMVPTLPPGTRVLGIGYFLALRPGNVVIVKHAGREKIKRISKIKNKELYILGDHPDTSTDSRQFGWISVKSVEALVIWPRTKLGAKQ